MMPDRQFEVSVVTKSGERISVRTYGKLELSVLGDDETRPIILEVPVPLGHLYSPRILEAIHVYMAQCFGPTTRTFNVAKWAPNGVASDSYDETVLKVITSEELFKLHEEKLAELLVTMGFELDQDETGYLKNFVWIPIFKRSAASAFGSYKGDFAQ